MNRTSGESCLDTGFRPLGDLPDAQSVQNTALTQLAHALKREGYHHTAVTPSTHACVNRRPGNERAINLEGVFGWSRPFYPSVIPREIFELMQAAEIITSHEMGLRSLVRASTLNNHLFFHSAYPTVEADAVFFGPDTYRFAAAIEHQLDTGSAPVHRAVDIGCGAGPGAIAVACRNPSTEVLAVDINDSALRLTAINAYVSGVANVAPCYSNLLQGVEGMFDLIVANPPYLVDPARRAYRHGGGAKGSGLSLDIIDAALQRLNPGGALLLYTGTAIINGVDRFRVAVERKLRSSGVQWRYTEIDPDVFGEELSCSAYADADRIAALTLLINQAK